jgi:hypothetical protein
LGKRNFGEKVNSQNQKQYLHPNKHHGKGTKSEPFNVKENEVKVTPIYFSGKETQSHSTESPKPQYPESNFREGKKRQE